VKAFTYLTPSSTAEAVGLLDEYAPHARVIAGGQTLLLAMKTRAERPGVLVSLAGIADLAGLRVADSGELVIGATTTYAALTRATLTGWHARISAVAGNLADRPVRTMGTIGGALCAADPRFDMLTLVTGTGGRLDVLAPSGVRTLMPQEFFRPGGGISLAPNEILASIRFPAADAYTSVTFEKFRQRTFDAAVASVLCAVRVDDAGRLDVIRVAVGAVSPTPVLAERTTADLTGSPVAAVDPDGTARRIVAEVFAGHGDTPDELYRRELVKALARRALRNALFPPRS
jgi:aerobic carbon-monoxide dehydrogenase medium subunit